mgnify:CR=1 FL=1
MDIAEKRVYDASAGRTRLAVATEQGLAIVGLSADVIGEFGLALRTPVHDVVPAGAGRLLVATENDLQLVALGDDGVAATAGTARTGVGATEAVAIADGSERDAATENRAAVVAAGSDGIVRRASLSAVLQHAGADRGDDAVDWADIGEATVRRADGALLATPDGVYRAGPSSIEHVGLDDVRDVAVPTGGAGPGPFAATGDGLFRLGPGWTEERSGAFELVTAGGPPDHYGRGSTDDTGSGSTDATDEESTGNGSTAPAAHAWSDGELLAREDDEWSSVEWPAGAAAADVSYAADGSSLFAVARDGTVLVDAGDGWRTRSIGLRGVSASAVVE